MGFINIDAPGNGFNRHAVRAIQKRHGADERKAAAQARRDLRKAKRAQSSPAFEKIAAGLSEALAVARGAAEPSKMHVPTATWSTACDSMADLDLPPTTTGVC